MDLSGATAVPEKSGDLWWRARTYKEELQPLRSLATSGGEHEHHSQQCEVMNYDFALQCHPNETYKDDCLNKKKILLMSLIGSWEIAIITSTVKAQSKEYLRFSSEKAYQLNDMGSKQSAS